MNLVSVSTLSDQGLKVEFLKAGCQVKVMKKQNNVIVEGIRIGGLYKLNINMENHHAMTSTCVSTKELWHKMYGHLILKKIDFST